MDTSLAASLLADYQWQLSLYAIIGIAALTFAYRQVVLIVPAFRESRRMNVDTFKKKMERPSYAANHAWNNKWSGLNLIVIFGLILPFCLTSEATPWWRMLADVIVILMFYDFFYYLTHRFLFHDNGVLGGPLKWMHAIHHRQHNPCLRDSSYIHPLEVAIGLGLYTASIFILSRFMGDFHVVTIVITFVAFTEINLHNHALWKADYFPFRYLNYASRMHHHHHARFTGGNYATISLLYDWMFGTLDHGEGYGKRAKPTGRAIPNES